MNYCPNCGQRLEPQWKVCPECGHPKEFQTYQPQQTPQPQQPIKQEITNEEGYSWFSNYGFGTLSLLFLIPFGLLFIIGGTAILVLVFSPHALILSIVSLAVDKKKTVKIISFICSMVAITFIIVIFIIVLSILINLSYVENHGLTQV